MLQKKFVVLSVLAIICAVSTEAYSSFLWRWGNATKKEEIKKKIAKEGAQKAREEAESANQEVDAAINATLIKDLELLKKDMIEENLFIDREGNFIDREGNFIDRKASREMYENFLIPARTAQNEASKTMNKAEKLFNEKYYLMAKYQFKYATKQYDDILVKIFKNTRNQPKEEVEWDEISEAEAVILMEKEIEKELEKWDEITEEEKEAAMANVDK